MFQTTNGTYLPRRHSFLRGPLTLILALWAIALPALLLIFAAFGPIGILLGAGAFLVLIIPWLLGLIIIGLIRSLT